MAVTRGDRVRQLREALRWTQQDLADKLTRANPVGEKVQPETVSRIENGRSDTSVPMLVALARVLETTCDYLTGLTDNPKRSEESDYPIPEIEVAPLVTDLNSQPAAFRRRAVDVLKAVLNFGTPTIADSVQPAAAEGTTLREQQLTRLLDALPEDRREWWLAEIARLAQAESRGADAPELRPGGQLATR